MTGTRANHMQQRVAALRSEVFSMVEELREKTFLGRAEERDVKAAIRLLSVANLLGQVESLTGLPSGTQGREAGRRFDPAVAPPRA